MRMPSLRWRCWSLGFVVVALLPASIVAHAQFDDDTGPAGRVDDGDSSPPPGPLGRVDERLPHPECDTCFTVPDISDYQVFEEITTADRAIILPRMIPNPAPIQANEIRARYDEETGEDIWYIGTQAFIGPTDEDYWSDEAPLPTIELQRIQMRHLDTILSIPGVHGFGIGPAGFVVSLTPDKALNAEEIPLALENVPVEVEVGEMPRLSSHSRFRFRPIPTGAGIASRMLKPNGQWYTEWGTLGPHVVRDEPHVGSCCQLWSLTAGHVVKYRLMDPNPAPGTRAVYQPALPSPPQIDHFGDVAHVFRLKPCDTPQDPFCDRPSAPINLTYEKPDVAAIDHGFRPPPFNDPTDTDPTRRLQASTSSYINGPSGRIRTAEREDEHKIWGAVTPAGDTGRVVSINQCQVIEEEIHRDPIIRLYKICGLNHIHLEVQAGDSGALVAYAGTGSRHVAGIFIARDLPGFGSWYIPANDIKMAFENAGKDFSHFWGTKSGYRAPSTQTCDPPGC